MCSMSGLSKAAALCAVAATVTSCYTCGTEPLGDVFVIRNRTTSSYI